MWVGLGNIQQGYIEEFIISQKKFSVAEVLWLYKQFSNLSFLFGNTINKLNNLGLFNFSVTKEETGECENWLLRNLQDLLIVSYT